MAPFFCLNCHNRKSVLTYALNPQPGEADPGPSPCPFCNFEMPEISPEPEPGDGPLLAIVTGDHWRIPIAPRETG